MKLFKTYYDKIFKEVVFITFSPSVYNRHQKYTYQVYTHYICLQYTI